MCVCLGVCLFVCMCLYVCLCADVRYRTLCPVVVTSYNISIFSLDWHPNNVLLAAGSSDFKTRSVLIYALYLCHSLCFTHNIIQI